MSSKAAFVKELDSLVKMAKRTASLARRAEEGEKEEESTDKGKKKGPPPKWEEFRKATYEGGEETSPESYFEDSRELASRDRGNGDA